MSKSDVKRIMIGLNKISQKGAINLALSIHGRLVEETPKDTGWAASNWVPQVGSPFSSTVGSPESIDDSQQTIGAVKLANWKFSQGPAYISNNVEYIQALNGGHSTQAPPLFVDKIVQSEVAKANRSALTKALDWVKGFFK